MSTLPGIGAQTQKGLEKLGIRNLFDLLLHVPIRYEDRTQIVPAGRLACGSSSLVEGFIESVEVEQRGRRAVVCRIADGTGSLNVRLFHYTARQLVPFIRGARVRCYGEVRSGPRGLEMVHPDYRFLECDESAPTEEHLTPIYPTKAGIHQKTLRRLSKQTLARLFEGTAILGDHLAPHSGPTGARLNLGDALRLMHCPSPADKAVLPSARQRLAFEELVAHRLSLLRWRKEMRRHQAPSLRFPSWVADAFQKALPFTLTGAQERVSREIERDLGETQPMMRLLQGDVGSGKTVIAARAGLIAATSGWQVAVMAPTELLAEQHHISFSHWLAPLEVSIVLLLGRHKGLQRNDKLANIASGQAGVIIGTHALFQQEVSFRRLGLVIIDEQHRFGVHQRLALREKGAADGLAPHQLIMTATPIPRTLAMVGYADLDLSVMDELPQGRTAVKTTAIPAERRIEVIDRIADWIARGRQAYWVCTLIDESEVLQCHAAEKTAALLATKLPGVRVALLHGRMKGDEKERIMQAFKARKLDLLVSTTVIEVGVDVPNAGLMIIENAERFGLSQLHQLRGRVGRGPGESFCVLLYQPPLSRAARERLEVMRRSSNGFEIAEKDWQLRGSGELLGTRQTGAANFRIAELPRDEWMLPRVAEATDKILREDPEIVSSLVRRWVGPAAHFAEV